MDAAGNVLLWNGEVFGGQLGAPEPATPGPEENDTDAVLAALGAGDADGLSEPDAMGRYCRATLSGVVGPWALVYLHRPSSTLHFGRDRLGRRSLCLLEDRRYVRMDGWMDGRLADHRLDPVPVGVRTGLNSYQRAHTIK